MTTQADSAPKGDDIEPQTDGAASDNAKAPQRARSTAGIVGAVAAAITKRDDR